MKAKDDTLRASLRKALEAYDTGRWQWERAHCTITGKDADLEPWGNQAFELIGADDSGTTIVAHAGKTVAGLDVCLNLPEFAEESDEVFAQCREAYLEAAESIVCDLGYPGDWSGDDWYLSFESDPIRVDWARDESGAIDFDATARACVDRLESALTEWESAWRSADEALDLFAGWRDEKGRRRPAGKPSRFAAFDHVLKTARRSLRAKSIGGNNEA